MVHLLGQMVADIRDSLKKTTLKGLGITLGLMVDNTKVRGRIIKCMEEVYFYGQMVGNMKDNM